MIAGDEIHGPFRLFITSSPAPAQVGSVTFAVRVTDAQSGATVKDADVRVTLARPDSDAQWEAIATHQDAGSPVDYAAHITIDQAGQYNGVIRVRAAAGQAEIAFVQPVLAPRSTTTLLIVALPFVAAFGILAALWLLRFRGRQAA